jgi:hypothetical protein
MSAMHGRWSVSTGVAAGVLAMVALGCATPDPAVQSRREVAIYPLVRGADTPKPTQRAVTTFVNTTTRFAKGGQATLKLRYDQADELAQICVEFADPEVARAMLAPLRAAEKLRVVEESCMDGAER